jgi:hypothetical protein
MEENQKTEFISLGIDSNSRDHLTEAASWAKFIAIIGFVFCGIIVVFGIFLGSSFDMLLKSMGEESEVGNIDMSGFGVIASTFYIGIAILYFFPCLFLFNFANYMKSALIIGDQEKMNKAFQNLKKTFRFIGILTIITLCFFALGILMTIAGASLGR